MVYHAGRDKTWTWTMALEGNTTKTSPFEARLEMGRLDGQGSPVFMLTHPLTLG